MPSRKVLAAQAGRGVVPLVQSGGKSAVRFAVMPEDDKAAREQEDRRAESDQQFAGTPFKSGKVHTVVFDNATLTKSVAHSLSRPAQGFIVVDLLANDPTTTIVRDNPTFSTAGTYQRQNTHITLRSSHPCTAKVWIW